MEGAKYLRVTVEKGLKAVPLSVTASLPCAVEGLATSVATRAGDRVGAGDGEGAWLAVGLALGLGDGLGVGVGDASATLPTTRSCVCLWHALLQQMRTVWLPSSMSFGTAISSDTLPFASAQKR